MGEQCFYVYIMTNRTRTLYTGVTNDLARRVKEHKLGLGGSFTSKYRISRLVFFEETESIDSALQREKAIKGWTRAKKIMLIEAVNPGWEDLSQELGLD